MQTILFIIASLCLLLLPGCAILVWKKQSGSSFPVVLADGIALSISLTAVLFLASFYLPLRITPLFLAISYSLCAAICFYGFLRRRKDFHWSRETSLTLILLGAVMALRFYQIRDLLLPAWVDSVHHTLITNALIANGAVPATLAPYLDVPFSYYFGFHGLAAAISLLSGLPAEKTILYLGQILNALMPLAIYRLGVALWGERGKALLAALLVAFVSQMPAYYVTWGRYTLLTGLIMLALVMAAVIDNQRRPGSFISLVLLGLNTIGLILSHYFSGLLLLAFVFIFLAQSLIKRNRSEIKSAFLTAAPIAMAIIILIPWLWRAFDLTGYKSSFKLSLPTSLDGWNAIQPYWQYLLRLSRPVRNYLFLALGFLGIVPTLIDKRSRSLAIWAVLILVTALPAGIRLPNIRPDHMAIILFFPLSYCAADLFALIWKFSSSRLPQKKMVPILTILPFVAFCIWGAVETRSIIKPETVFVNRADIEAIGWIRSNIAADARFMINAAYWQGSYYRGVDGGFWLLPLAGIQTVPPPVAYYWGDTASDAQMISLTKGVAELKNCNASFWESIDKGRLTHIYLKQGAGAIQVEGLLPCDGLLPIYARGGVTILQVTRSIK